MLKPVDPGPSEPERPIGELVHQLLDDAKAYARSEIDLLQAIAEAKAKVVGIAAALVGAAFIFALAAVTALAVGVVIALAGFIGPLAAGFIGLCIFAAVAGSLAWYGIAYARREL